MCRARRFADEEKISWNPQCASCIPADLLIAKVLPSFSFAQLCFMSVSVLICLCKSAARRAAGEGTERRFAALKRASSPGCRRARRAYTSSPGCRRARLAIAGLVNRIASSCVQDAFLVKPQARDGVCEFGASAFCTDVAMATIYIFPLREREKASRTHDFATMEPGGTVEFAEVLGYLTECRFRRVSRPGGCESAVRYLICLLYTSPSPRDLSTSRMPSSA